MIVILAGLGLREMWQVHHDTNPMSTRQRISQSMTQMQNLIDAVSSHVKALTELHGGSVDLESEPERGTKVVLNFPADRMISRPTGKAA